MNTIQINQDFYLDFLLIDCDYRISKTRKGQKSIIRIFGKTDNGIQIVVYVTDFSPYFYIYNENGIAELFLIPEFPNLIIKFESITKRVYFGGKPIKVYKISVRTPEHIKKILQLLPQYSIAYEYDIPFVHRFLIDTGLCGLQVVRLQTKDLKPNRYSLTVSYKDLSPRTNPIPFSYTHKIASFYIETFVNNDLEIKGYEKNKFTPHIKSISLSYYENTKILNTKISIREDSIVQERDVLVDFLLKFRQISPDIILFYDTKFQLLLLKQRLEAVGLGTYLLSVTQSRYDKLVYDKTSRSYRIKGRLLLDLAEKTKELHPASITGKKDLLSLYQMLKNAPSDTNHVTPSEILLELYTLLCIPQQLEVKALAGMPPVDAILATPRNIGEFELLRVCHKTNLLIPALPTKEKVQQRLAALMYDPHVGGFIYEPVERLYTYVTLLDFKSMYPSIVISRNIGGETFTGQDNYRPNPLQPPDELFTKEPPSALAIVEQKFLELRKTLKETYKISKDKRLEYKQSYTKYIINCLCGSHNYPQGRFFSSILGNSVTYIARAYLRVFQEKIQNYDPQLEVVYGDTDSLFVWQKNFSFPENLASDKPLIPDSIKNVVVTKTNALIQYLTQFLPDPMEIEIEDLAYRILFQPERCKTYAYVSLLSNTFTIKGFEVVRSNINDYMKKIQYEVIKEILLTDNNQEKVKQILLKYIHELWTRPLNELKDQLKVFSPITRQLDQYKSPPPVVHAFMQYCQQQFLDPHTEWHSIDRFPWIIIPGKSIVSVRAKHPDYVKNIDRFYYMKQIISIGKQFDITIANNDIQKSITLNNVLLKFI